MKRRQLFGILGGAIGAKTLGLKLPTSKVKTLRTRYKPQLVEYSGVCTVDHIKKVLQKEKEAFSKYCPNNYNDQYIARLKHRVNKNS